MEAKRSIFCRSGKTLLFLIRRVIDVKVSHNQAMRACRFYRWFAGLLLAVLAPHTCMAATQVLTVNTNGSGTVHRNPTNMVVPQGAVVTLTAIPSTNWMFTFWSGDASGSTNPLNVTMDRDKTIVANFSVRPSYTLTVNVFGQGSVHPPGGTYPSDTMVSLTATPETGWVFVRWTGSASGTANPLTITMNGNKTVTAVFVQPPMILSHPQSASANTGDDVTFLVSASGTPPLSYAWQFNGSNIPAATQTNLVLTNVQPANAGHYRVVVTNAGGSTTSQAARLSVDCDGSNVVTVCNETELRQAIARGGRVEFCCNGTISLTSTIEITNNVELTAADGYNVVISGRNSVRLFKVSTNITFTLVNISLVNGRHISEGAEEASGGAIYNDGGNLRLFSCIFSNNQAIGGQGGGVNPSARGGAVFNRSGTIWADGLISISNSAIGTYRGGGGGAGLGGAIFSQGGVVSMVRAAFIGNAVGSHAPGLASGGAVRSENALIQIHDSTFNGNRATGGSYQPVFAVAPPWGPAAGGALWTSGTAIVARCEFRANSANGGGGPRSMTESGDGGGLYNSGTACLNATTFVENVCRGEARGGGILNAGTMFGTNCTLALNRVETGSQNGATGGGIRNVGMLYLINVTVASNITVRSISNAPPRGANLAGTLALRNCLVAYGVGISNGVPDPVSPGNAAGTITDDGFNISSDGSCNFMSGSSFNFTDPRLGPLVDNGGPTSTMRPRPDSPAIDYGTADGSPPFDQRGARRPSGPGVDMGAYEVGPIAPILMVQRNASMLNLSFMAEAGVSYQLRYSTNLVAWQLQEGIGTAPTNRTISRSIPISGPRRFFRVQ
jgi:hypothetical protein